MSKADKLFVNMCKEILENGYSDEGQEVRPRWEDGTPAHTIKTFGVCNKYDLSEEFPALTLRPTAIKSAVDELLWIWQKKSNRVEDLNSSIWDEWVGEDGTIGKAYGYQLGQKYVHHIRSEGEEALSELRKEFPSVDFIPLSDGRTGILLDQVDGVLYDLKYNRSSRRIMTNIYNFTDLHEMNLYPCAYSMTFNVTGNKLNAILNQRSQDTLTANNWNVVQYAVLVYMFAQVSGLEPGTLVHMISDAHIYDRHIPIIDITTPIII